MAGPVLASALPAELDTRAAEAASTPKSEEPRERDLADAPAVDLVDADADAGSTPSAPLLPRPCWADTEVGAGFDGVRDTGVGDAETEVTGAVVTGVVTGTVVTGDTGGVLTGDVGDPLGVSAELRVMANACTAGTTHTVADVTSAPRLSTSRRVNARSEIFVMPHPRRCRSLCCIERLTGD